MKKTTNPHRLKVIFFIIFFACFISTVEALPIRSIVQFVKGEERVKRVDTALVKNKWFVKEHKSDKYKINTLFTRVKDKVINLEKQVELYLDEVGLSFKSSTTCQNCTKLISSKIVHSASFQNIVPPVKNNFKEFYSSNTKAVLEKNNQLIKNGNFIASSKLLKKNYKLLNKIEPSNEHIAFTTKLFETLQHVDKPPYRETKKYLKKTIDLIAKLNDLYGTFHKGFEIKYIKKLAELEEKTNRPKAAKKLLLETLDKEFETFDYVDADTISMLVSLMERYPKYNSAKELYEIIKKYPQKRLMASIEYNELATVVFTLQQSPDFGVKQSSQSYPYVVTQPTKANINRGADIKSTIEKHTNQEPLLIPKQVKG